MATTTNYGWTTPDDTSLVKDGASAIRTLGTSIDTTTFNNASAAIAKTIVDAKGDIIAATAADTVSRLAVGANDTVLTADSTAATGLKWASVASGGMTLISTTSLTGASVALTSIPQSYVHLELIVLNYKSSTASQLLNLRFNQDSTANNHALSTGAGALTYNQTKSQISKAENPATSQSSAVITIFNYTNATIRKRGLCITLSEASEDEAFTFNMAYKPTTAISSFDLFPDSGNFSTGTVLLYGVK